MNYTARYEVTPTMQEKLTRFYFLRVVLRPQLWRIVLMTAVLVFFALKVPREQHWSIFFLVFLAVSMVSGWLRAYASHQRFCRSSIELLDDNQMEVSFDEDGIRYLMRDSAGKFLWNKVRRIVESEDFMILMYGGVPLMSLPKAPFSEEALAFIRQKSWVERKD